MQWGFPFPLGLGGFAGGQVLYVGPPSFSCQFLEWPEEGYPLLERAGPRVFCRPKVGIPVSEVGCQNNYLPEHRVGCIVAPFCWNAKG